MKNTKHSVLSLMLVVAMAVGCHSAINAQSTVPQQASAQIGQTNDSADNITSADIKETATTLPDSISDDAEEAIVDEETMEGSDGFYTTLKTKFIEGNAGFMSLVALALILGLAFCIERIVYLTLSRIDTHRFMTDLCKKIETGDIESAKNLCRNTRGPVASICYQGLLRINEKTEEIERSIANYGSVMIANMEKGCSWITLFIAIAPSLGFLGTVIGMVMSFDQIQMAGDISPTIVASGMKVALITTIFGIIVAIILQLFYNYILTKIEHLTVEMEDSAITLVDEITKYNSRNEH